MAQREGITSPSAPAGLPVKNTFIHFNISAGDVSAAKPARQRILRRCHTDSDDYTSLCSLPSTNVSSDAGSTGEAASEADPLETSFEAIASLDLDDCNTPEHTPRHVRDPWASPASSISCQSAQEPWTSQDDGCVSANDVGFFEMSTFAPAQHASVSLAQPDAFSPDVESSSGLYFNFTLRLADDVGLGVDLMPCLDGKQNLVIRGILPNGAMAAWNLQCCDGSMKQLKAVWPGDAIVCVNGKTDPSAMMRECKASFLLKITVCREMARDTGLMIPAWPGAPALGAATWVGRTVERLESSKKTTIRI